MLIVLRPIKKFIIDGLIYDSLNTLRFIFATVYYYLMVRFIYIFKQGKIKRWTNWAYKGRV